jgi:hypothetical protein
MWWLSLLFGVVEWMGGTNKSSKWSTKKHEHESKLATRLDHEEHKLNKVTELKLQL